MINNKSDCYNNISANKFVNIFTALRHINKIIETDISSAISKISKIIVEHKIFNSCIIVLTDNEGNCTHKSGTGISNQKSFNKAIFTQKDINTCSSENISINTNNHQIKNGCPFTQFSSARTTYTTKIHYQNNTLGYISVSLKSDNKSEVDIFKELTTDITNVIQRIINQNNQYSLSSGTINKYQQQLYNIDLNKEEKFNKLIEDSPVGILIYQDDYWVYSNKSATTISGYTNDEILKMRFWEFTHADFREIVKKQGKNRQLGQNAFFRYSFRIITKKGTLKWVDLTGNTISFKGKPAGIIFITDITQRIDIENELKLSLKRESLMADLVRNASIGIVVGYPNKTMGINNLAFSKITGYTKEEISKLNFINDLTPKEWHKYEQSLLDFENNNAQYVKYEKELIKKNGDIVPVELIAHPQFNKNGDLESYFAFINDISAKKKNEKEIKEKEKKLSQIVYGNAIATIVIDNNHIITNWNAACEKLVGIKEEEIIGTSDQWKAFYPNKRPLLANILLNENPSENIEKYYTNKYRKNLIIENCYEVEDFFPNLGKSGLWLLFTAAPIFNDEGKIDGAIETFQDITKQKNAEIKLTKSENLLNEVGDIAKVGGWEIDFDNKSTYWTKTTYDILDYNYHEKIPDFNDYVKYYLPKYKEAVISMMNTLIKDHKPFSFEAEMITKKGNKKWLKEIGKPRYINGILKSYYGTFQDITDQKNTELKLLASENKLSSFIKQSIDAITITDSEGNFLIWNKSQEHITGYTFAEISKMKIWELQSMLSTVSNSKSFTQEKFQNLFAKTKNNISLKSVNKPVDHEIKRKDGKNRTLQQIVFPIRIDTGFLFGSISRDITDLKEAQNQLTKTKEVAEENRKLLQLSLKTNTASVFRDNLITGEMFCTPEMFYHFGYSDSEIPTTVDGFMDLIHPEDVQSVIDALNSHIQDDSEEYYSEFRIKGKNGEYLWIDGRGKIVEYSSDGKPKILLGLSRDITKIQEVKEQLIIAKEKAEEADRLKSAFLANMSHEIRTPMNGIIGFTTLLKDKKITSDKKEKYINIIQQSGERLLSTVNDIIEVSKIETGQIIPNIQLININQQLEYHYTFFKIEAEKKGLLFTYIPSLSNDESMVDTDINMFNSIISNLLKNAIKYTHSGKIEFGYKYIDNTLEFYVRDTGIGIENNRIEAIFDRFIQADIEDREAYEGSGLGLSIAKSYIEMLNGKIWVESETTPNNSGSAFFFSLNYNMRQSIKQHSPIVTKNKGIKKNKNLKILIAEDDTNSFDHLSIIIEKYASEIIHATTGTEAVEICKNNSDIDLVLMDVKMPILNGHEASKKIREFNKDIVIIAQTSYAMIGDRKKAIISGCNDYISKPILENELYKLIDHYFI